MTATDIGTQIGTCTRIGRYPVKSMQGDSPTDAEVTGDGVVGDRSWGVFDTETGLVLTAKRKSRLLDATATLEGGVVTVTLPDGTPCPAGDPATDEQLCRWLGRPVALRPPSAAGTEFEMSFNIDDPDTDRFRWPTLAGTLADLAPLHLITTSSLAAARQGHPNGEWSVHRFRPSVVIDTGDAPAFVENDWVGRRLVLGEVEAEVTMPTIRCSLPTKPQAINGLARDLDIFRSLSAHNGQNLGAYATVRTPGRIQCGDPVRLLD